MLKLADGLRLPVHLVTESVGILAKRRAGKSTTARRLAEQLHKAKQQVVVADPKGDWWGLLFGIDGRSPGLSFVVLGGEHGHIKLEAGAGELVARMVVTERVSLVLDLSEFRKHEVATFMTAFMETLYRLKAQEQYRTPLMLIIDEADAIAPQKPQKGEERMLGAAEDLVRRGGQRGIGVTMITQRSAVLNKNLLTQIGMLVVLRTIAPQDLAAMDAWIDVHGTVEQRKALMASLPSLPTGTGWVWAPGWPDTDGVFQKAAFLLPETFDSSATPGQQKRVEPKNAADVDLEAFKREMAATIEKAKADDPRELRKQIVKLQQQVKTLAASENLTTKVREKVVEKPVLKDGQLARAEQLVVKIKAASDRYLAISETFQKLDQELGEIGHELAQAIVQTRMSSFVAKKLDKETVPAVTTPASAARPVYGRGSTKEDRAYQAVTPVAPTGAPMAKMHRAMLTVLAQAGKSLSRKQIRVRTSYRDSGPVSSAFAWLQQEGLAAMNGTGLFITPEGLAALGDYEVLPSGVFLRSALVSGSVGKLSAMERKFLDVLIRSYPADLSKSELRERCSYADSGPVSSAFGHLVALDYATAVGKGRLKASEELFDDEDR